jgi:CcmD family protein
MRTIRLLVLSLALAAAPSVLAAQEGAPAVELPAAAGAEAPPAQSVEGAAPSSALPPRYTPPRTLRAYWHLFVAFAVAWVLLFGYTVALARRWGRLERELEGLAGR